MSLRERITVWWHGLVGRLRLRGRVVSQQLTAAWRRLVIGMLLTWKVIKTWLCAVLRFLRSVGAFIFHCLRWFIEGIGSLAIRLGKVYLPLVGVVVFGIIPCIFYGILLNIIVSYTAQNSLTAWFVLVLSQLIIISWIWTWIREEQPMPRVFIKTVYYVVFYVLSLFLFSTTLFAYAYMAAGKLGDNVTDLATGYFLVGFWDHMRFSILTATTLGQANVTTRGISCVLECTEVVVFWFLIVITSWKLQGRNAVEFGAPEILGPQKNIVEF